MIRVTDLRKSFRVNRKARKELEAEGFKGREVVALDGVSFECRPGRIFGLLGPNGAGKTTALRVIATMLRPSSGEVTVAGLDAVREPEKVRERIGFLTGNTGLYDRLTPIEMVRYHADLHGMSAERFESRRRELFAQLDMEWFASRRISRLSTGMKQKVSIVRTMIHDPEVMVFDEPTAGLDVMTSRRIIDLIRTCREDGKTVLFSTHLMSEVQLLCDDIAIIHKGRLFFEGAKHDFESGMTRDTYEDEFIHLVGEN